MDRVWILNIYIFLSLLKLLSVLLLFCDLVVCLLLWYCVVEFPLKWFKSYKESTF